MDGHRTPASASVPAPDRDALRARALDGARALVELLGGDPAVPRLAGLPERYVEAMCALVPGAAPGASLPHGRTAPQTIADILAPPDPDDGGGEVRGAGPLTGFPRVTATAAAFTAVCDIHLMPFTGTLHLAHDPGRDDDPPAAHRLTWLAAVLARGLTSDTAIAMRAVHALRKHLAGQGSAAHIHLTGPCPHPHRDPPPPPNLTGSFRTPLLGRAFTRWAGIR